ncbi:MAG: response regulator [Proteobacteria bacterium]|nr:response regulator [Pseudomonadota bacterium]MBU4326890.1 response regulator [Pseudomonadota bacterium]
MPNKTVSNNLKSVALYLLLLLAGAAIFYPPYRIVRDNTIQALNAQQLILARQAAKGIEEHFHHYRSILAYLAKQDSIIRIDRQGRQLLEDMYGFTQGSVSAVTRIDASGHILATVPDNSKVLGMDVSGQEHNRRIIQTHQAQVSEVFTAAQGYRTVAFAYPVFDSGVYVGCISILIPFETITKRYLADIIIGADGYAWLISAAGVELYCPVPGHIGKTVDETSAQFPSVLFMARKMMAGDEGTAVYDYDRIKNNQVETIRKQAVYSPIQLPGTRWSVVVATPERQALQAINAFGIWWVTLFCTVMAVGAFLLRSRIIIRESRQRLQAEQRLLEQERIFSRFIDSSHIPIIIVGTAGQTRLINGQCQNTYGYTLEDVPTIGTWFARTFPNKKTQEEVLLDWQNKLHTAIETGEGATFKERSIVCKDGSFKDVILAFTLVDDTIIITLNDQTGYNRLQRVEQDLHNHQARTSKMEAIGLMAGGVAHDLNNILSGIVGYPELVLRQLPQDSNLQKPLQLMHEAGLRAAAVVADLLTIARGVASTKKPANLNTLVTEYLESPEGMMLQALHPEVQIISRLTPAPCTVSCSPVHIRKSIMNLITNAAEAIVGPGNIHVSTSICDVDESSGSTLKIMPGKYALLLVTDSGSGIAQADLEHIFEPFYTKKVMGRSGTGLGLSVVWSTVQDHGGGINVESSEKGTSFALYFPVSTDGEPETRKEQTDLATLQGKGESILVVDDEPQQRDIASRMLEQFGYSVETASSGEEAVQFLREKPMDLILLDMLMSPGINGRETYKQIIAIHPGQKAVITSGYARSIDVEEATALGAGEFITKPYTMEGLGRAVRDELAR